MTILSDNQTEVVHGENWIKVVFGLLATSYQWTNLL